MAAHSLGDEVALIATILTGIAQRGPATARHLRQSTGLSTSAAAKLAGCSPETLTSWENETSLPGQHQGLVWYASMYAAAGWRARVSEEAAS